MSNIKERFYNIIINVMQLDIPAEELNGDQDLTTLGLNSIAFIKLLVAVEQEFDTEFSDDDLDFAGYETLNDILGLLEKKLAE